MAQRVAAIAKGSAGDGNEFPLITGRLKRKLDHTMAGRVAHLAIELDRADFVEPRAAGADNEVTHAARIGIAIGVQSSKAFVNMIMAGDGNIHGMAEKNFDQIAHVRMVAVILTGADERMMPVGQRALGAIRS